MKVVLDLYQAGIIDLHNDKDAEDVISIVSSHQPIVYDMTAAKKESVEEISTRDRLLRDITAETVEEDRGRLTTVAVNT